MTVTILGASIEHTAVTYQRAETPLFQDRITAGFPSPAQDYIERTLDLNELCVKHPAATFFVRVEGNSMVNVGIHPGDILVVDRALEAHHKDIVIANIDDEYTVKELSCHPPGLLAHNPAFAPIWLQEGQQLEIFGVVTNVIREIRRQ